MLKANISTSELFKRSEHFYIKSIVSFTKKTECIYIDPLCFFNAFYFLNASALF
jgi:hypothetical protein